MIKRIISLSLVFTILFCLFGCKDNGLGAGDTETCHYSSEWWCGFGEECSDDIRDLKVTSFEISSSYENELENPYNGSGYYVILGVETNLIEHDFTHPQNVVALRLFYDKYYTLNLDFLKFDAENGKLVYGIPYDESVDYDAVSKLKVSEEQAYYEPLLRIALKCFDGYFYLSDSDLYYHARSIVIHLE